MASIGSGVSGTALAVALAGAVLAYSGLKGKSISTTARAIISGQDPSNVAQSVPVNNPASPLVPGGSTYNSQVPTNGDARQQVVAFARAQIGKRYVFAAAGPDAYDCSGLTMKAYEQVGISLPHFAAAQYAIGKHISADQLQPGDLIFYYTPIDHVAIYSGNNMLIQASEPGVPIQEVPVYNNAKNPIVGYASYL